MEATHKYEQQHFSRAGYWCKDAVISEVLLDVPDRWTGLDSKWQADLFI